MRIHFVPESPRLRNATTALLYAGVLAGLLATSWLRWPDAWIDFGRFLYYAWRLANGARLGIDLIHFYGPIPLMGWGALFRLLGPSIILVYFVHGALLVLDIFLLHRIFARLSYPVAAGNTLLFLCVFALGQYIVQGNYNYLAPYKPEATFGVTALLLLVDLAVPAAAREIAVMRSAAVGALVGLLALVATEYFIAALAVSAVLWLSGPPYLSRRAFLLGSLLPPLLVCGALLLQFPPDRAFSVTFRALQILGNRKMVTDPAFLSLMGLDNPARSLWLLARACGATAVFLLAACACRGRAAALFFASAPAVAVLALGRETAFLAEFARILPALAAAGILVWILDRRRLLLGAWSALALALLPRMFLQPTLSHYGFTLAMPAALLLLPLLVEVLPSLRQRGRLDFRGASWSGAGLALALVASALVVRQRAFDHKTVEVSAGRDPLYDWEPGFQVGPFHFGERGPALRAAIEDLRARLRPGDELLALPNGYIVNYLLKVQRPTPYSFSVGDLKETGENVIVEAYERARPRFVLVLDAPFGEDVEGFGTRVGRSLLEWVHHEYRRVAVYGAGAKLTLYER